MPKSISAIRRYPTTTFLAFLLFLATLAVATGSLGIVRPGGNGGGGSEDGGSGFGGTGRSGEFGGSGLGGTGMPSPFITLDDSREDTTSAPQPVQTPVHDLVEPALITPAGRNQPALAIAVEMAVETTPEPEALAERAVPEVDIIDEATLEPVLLQPVALPKPIQVVEAPVIEPVVPAIPTEILPVENLSAVQEAPQLVDSPPPVVAPIVAPIVESEADSADRNVLPERIQRPELPPFQRVQPIERPSIAAPPVMTPARPM